MDTLVIFKYYVGREKFLDNSLENYSKMEIINNALSNLRYLVGYFIFLIMLLLKLLQIDLFTSIYLRCTDKALEILEKSTSRALKLFIIVIVSLFEC